MMETEEGRAEVTGKESGTTDPDKTLKLIKALGRFGIRPALNAEANWRTLRDAWMECLTETYQAVTGRENARFKGQKAAFEELCKEIRSCKLIPFLEQDPDRREDPAPEVTRRASRVKNVPIGETSEEEDDMATKKATTKKSTTKAAKAELTGTVKLANDKEPKMEARAAIKKLVPAGAKGVSIKTLIANAVKKTKLTEKQVEKHIRAMVGKGFITVG